MIAANTTIRIDDSAAYRQPEMFMQYDITQLTKNERIAYNDDINYIDMYGDIGVMSNGAGLAMATCDYIAEIGGKPLNFAEIGN